MFAKRILRLQYLARIATKRNQSTTTDLVAKLEATASLDPPKTFYRITLLRSAIALPKRYKDTLVALGIHRRMQTVYHAHRPDIAGKILRVKELVRVENVPERAVRTKTEQRLENRPTPGFEVIGNWRETSW